MNLTHYLRASVLALATFVTGCASITGTTNQNVSIQTLQASGAEVADAKCELTNAKGKWFVTTPESVGITRSNDDMPVICKKEGREPGRAWWCRPPGARCLATSFLAAALAR